MTKPKVLYFSPEVILYPLLLVLAMWIVFWAEIRFSWDFTFLGIYPRKLSGIFGVLAGPFIHGSLKHLFNNSVPLFVLSSGLFYFYRNMRWKVLIYGLILSGLLTWLIGRPAIHIGASGVVYMLAAFLFFKGIFSKQYSLIAFSLVVVFLYGGLLWYVMPIDPRISWEGHLSGFLIGLILAAVFKELPVENAKYEWEKEDYKPEEDDFLKQFDENGNFIEKLPVEKVSDLQNNVEVIYTLKQNKDSDL